MNLIGSKTLETDRLILRATEESDLKKLWEILCIPEVNQYYLTTKLSYNWEDEIKWQYLKLRNAKNPDVFQWSIILKENRECIGQISVQPGETDDFEKRDIGWFLSPQYQRKGLAYEAAKEVLNYMFNEVQIKSIDTSAAIVNPASWGLMEKLGFKRIIGKNQFHKYTFVEDLVEGYSYHIDASLIKDYSKEKNDLEIEYKND